MNKMETLLDSLQRQQAQIEDKEAFADRVMERIEGVEDYIPRHYRGTPLRTYPGLTATPLKRGWGRGWLPHSVENWKLIKLRIGS